MTKRDWARKAIAPYVYEVRRFSGPMLYQDGVEALLQAERARARRIVRAYRKELHREWVKDEWDRELLCGVCDEILKRLG